jgi:SOS response regulatory protein OraA/RecX
LSESGLQSDERFAEAFALQARVGRGLSSYALQGELRRRGVDKVLAAEAATESPEEEERRARTLAVRRAARLAGLPEDVRNRRLMSYLARRGYPSELCARLVAETAENPVP